MKNQRLLLSFAVLLAAAPVLLSLSGCSDKVGTPTGPGTTTDAGMGRLLYSSVDFAQSNSDYSLKAIDSTGANLGTIGKGLVWSSGTGKFVWEGIQGSDTGVFVTDNGLSNSKLIAPGSAAYPMISLDGMHVAITLSTSSYANTELVVLSGTDFSHQNIISSTVAHETQPCLSPDGSQVAFYDSVDGTRALSIANSDGSASHKIATISDWGVDYEGAIDWCQRGDKLAFFDGYMVRVINTDGTGEVAIDSGSTPSWSPDGKTLAYATGDGEIMLTSDLGKTKRNITNTNQLYEAFPRWSPDGKKIACISWIGDLDHTTTSVKLIDVATGASKILATPGYAATWLR